MSKKIVALVSIALLLVAFAAFACAETEVTVAVPNGQGVAHAEIVMTKSANHKIAAQEKATVDVTIKRGGTLTLWYWYNGSGGYNMRTANTVDDIRYTVLGSWSRATVVSGTSWLGVKASGSGFTWGFLNDNYSTTARKGQIRITDAYGTVCNIVIRQCPVALMLKLSQLDGRAHDGEFRVNSSRISGTHGKVVYVGAQYSDYIDDYTPVKFTRGVIWFHKNQPLYQTRYYFVRPARVMAGVRMEGPTSNELNYYLTH